MIMIWFIRDMSTRRLIWTLPRQLNQIVLLLQIGRIKIYKKIITRTWNFQKLYFRLDVVKSHREQKEATIPTTLELEKKVNPFVRLEQSDAIKTATGQDNRILIAAQLREMKNNF